MNPKNFRKYVLLFFITILTCVNAQGQQTAVLEKIDDLISSNKFDEANKVIAAQNNRSILGHLVYPTGQIELLKNPNTPFNDALELFKRITTENHNDSISYQANLGMGLLHLAQGTVVKATPYLSEANSLAYMLKNVKKIITSEHYLSELGLKLGDFNALVMHNNKALTYLQENKGQEINLTPRIYNYKASLMHFTAKPDSADFYFKRAIKSIDSTNTDPEQRYYLPANIYGNWFLVKQSAGDLDNAMKFTLKTISSYNDFLVQAPNHRLTERVHGNLNIAYRNLGGLYYDLGQKEKAKQIAMLGYNHAKEHFLPNTVENFSAILMVGESLLYNTNFSEAETYLLEAEEILQTIPGDNTSYRANLYGVLGDLAYNKKDFSAAINYYQQALDAYNTENSSSFSQNQIYNLLHQADSYASLKKFDLAETIIKNTLKKVVKRYGDESFLANEIRTELVKLLFEQKAYDACIELGENILASYRKNTYENELSKIYFGPNQSKLLLYVSRAHFEKNTKITAKNLEESLTYLKLALMGVEKRKSLVSDPKDVQLLLENSSDIFDFAKELYYTLYQSTNNGKYLEKLIELHESSIYHRIRTRLNLSSTKLIPQEVQKLENDLRTKVNSFFSQESQSKIDVPEWKSSIDEWEQYLEMLRKDYPKYYYLKYQTVISSLQGLQDKIDIGTTVVRYLFLKGRAHAIVISKDSINLFLLPGEISDDCFENLTKYNTPLNDITECLNKLHKILWEPLESELKTENIIIVPDRELFNLSFELLSKDKADSFEDLAKKSLLAKHNISYNYSLLLLNKEDKILEFEKELVAYAPEFNKEMKNNYQMLVTDSLNLDKTYLTLLPQPFSLGLATKFSERYDGKLFLNESASKQVFLRTAQEHKIIHIGTHAESNNLNPELSRLVFAKNVSDSTSINDNFLYTYEIYNQNLNSNLAILTACETGKPSYQPGEGMISLAHAFNYAGSESILTSLWQIDEKSSSKILEYFYEHLEDGKSKDEALRLAKLDYLKIAEGRTLHPQYWAGLVLMGDTTPVKLNAKRNWRTWWIILGLLAIIGSIFLTLNKKKNPSKY